MKTTNVLQHFDINPHVIRQLGDELVSDSVTALTELIKNSYDADADVINVTIDTEGVCPIGDLKYPKHKGYIIVDDDGFGMTQEIIEKSWLIISYSMKRAKGGEPKPKTPKGRTPLGEKGLGRLSTQRLADCCEMFTQMEGEQGLHVAFNWRDFDNVEKLGDVHVGVNPTTMNRKCGTRLVLTNLRDIHTWNSSNIERFKANLCQMISPYESKHKFSVSLKINGEVINLRSEISKLDQLSVSHTLFKYKDGRVYLDLNVNMRKIIGNDYDSYQKLIMPDNGKDFLDYFFNNKSQSNNFDRATSAWVHMHQEFNLLDIPSPSVMNSMKYNPGDFNGEIREFTFDRRIDGNEWWSDFYKDFDEYYSFIQGQIGIKLFRDGFAIRPYGIEGNDWLGLGGSQTSGSSYYGMRPKNVIGYIAIDEGNNRNLRDKTDREGLIENDYYFVFMDILNQIVSRVGSSMEGLRRCYNDYRNMRAKDNEHIKTLSEAYNTLSFQSQKSKDIVVQYKEARKQVESAEKKVKQIVEESSKPSLFETDIKDQTLFKELGDVLTAAKDALAQADEVIKKCSYMDEVLDVVKPKIEILENQLEDFASLASLGLVSEMASHDLGQIALRFMQKSNELEKALSTGKEVNASDVYGVITFIRSMVSSIRNQIRHLDSSMRYAREKVENFSISDFVEKEEEPFYSQKLLNKKIDFDLVTKNDFDISFNKGRLIQVIDNLMNNSIYWLERKQIKNPKITITIDKPYIYVEDNGIGIEKAFEENLFEPFVTAKPTGEGRGLGLFIVRQLLSTRNCDIVLAQVRNSYENRYRFIIDLNNAIEK